METASDAARFAVFANDKTKTASVRFEKQAFQINHHHINTNAVSLVTVDNRLSNNPSRASIH
jgi:hypothetical protein